MGWDPPTPLQKPVQKKIFEDLTDSEQQIVNIFMEKNERHIDEISSLALMPGSHLSSALLTLELKNLIRSLPGKRYQLL
jgi:DNA processing protein